jgi:hypothetical protein
MTILGSVRDMENTQKVSLPVFLKARLDEDHWEAYKFRNDSQWDAEMLARLFRRPASDPVIWHLARYDAARALREVEAKRAILLQWEHSPPGSPVLTNALYQLAAVYSDHPDYDPGWTP